MGQGPQVVCHTHSPTSLWCSACPLASLGVCAHTMLVHQRCQQGHLLPLNLLSETTSWQGSTASSHGAGAELGFARLGGVAMLSRTLSYLGQVKDLVGHLKEVFVPELPLDSGDSGSEFQRKQSWEKGRLSSWC